MLEALRQCIHVIKDSQLNTSISVFPGAETTPSPPPGPIVEVSQEDKTSRGEDDSEGKSQTMGEEVEAPSNEIR